MCPSSRTLFWDCREGRAGYRHSLALACGVGSGPNICTFKSFLSETCRRREIVS